jgi:hypothetical protein
MPLVSVGLSKGLIDGRVGGIDTHSLFVPPLDSAHSINW